MTSFLWLLLAVVLNVAAQVALKWAAMGLGGGPAGSATVSFASIAAHPLRVATNPWFVVGILLYGISVINWLVVLGRMELSVAYPVMSLGYILTLIIGVLVFKEPISLIRMVGVLVIMVGVLLITRPVGSPHA